jgi:hypothetical protein
VIDGGHVSTGFNKVGMPDRGPQDPDFRVGMPKGAWGALLGPIANWVLAAGFTIWLLRRRDASVGTQAIGVFAIMNALVRSVPMTLFLASAALGRPYLEDEVGVGVEIVTRFCQPGLASVEVRDLLRDSAGLLVSEPIFWAPSVLSLLVSLALLVPATVAMARLHRAHVRAVPLTALALPLTALAATMAGSPLINWLDRLVRINW